MRLSEKEELTRYLSNFITEDRYTRLQQVLNQRTRNITMVLEDIYQPQNASAVLRSCDGFGVQDVHIIENRNAFRVSKGVTIGAEQWLTLYRYNEESKRDEQYNTVRCYTRLRENGYRIIGTTPREKGKRLQEIDIDEKTAIVMGAEYEGLSEKAFTEADDYAYIPMAGFSESFNISVSAALILYDLTNRLRQSDRQWQLTKEERIDLMLEWVRNSVTASEQLEKRYWSDKQA